MSKDHVIKKLGEPRVARGSVRNQHGQIIEVWEYRLVLPSQDSAGEVIGKSALTLFTLGMAAGEFAAPQKDYWLYFLDDKLAQWGEAGDWQVERERLYRVEFGTGPRLSNP